MFKIIFFNVPKNILETSFLLIRGTFLKIWPALSAPESRHSEKAVYVDSTPSSKRNTGFIGSFFYRADYIIMLEVLIQEGIILDAEKCSLIST